MTYILGVNLSHDRSAAIVKDGEVLDAIEEERLDRIKHSEGFLIQGHFERLTNLDLILGVPPFEKSRLDEKVGKLPKVDFDREHGTARFRKGTRLPGASRSLIALLTRVLRSSHLGLAVACSRSVAFA